MRNNLGIYKLFGKNDKAKKLFYEWCASCDELCEYDVEQIAHDLGLPCIDNSHEYIYFSTGNILDFLEEHGYYIGLPLRGKFKFVTCCYFKTSNHVPRPFYNNSGVVGRVKALEIGITKCLDEMEKYL